ncbi:MAG TPA: HEAT repeat domain-containing protein [Candidatus Polarisedimenticolaceae bacterium]|nr:HEAT repeat domain-containing protein [Candidatus Polarisedimenticolaceae bacterium]
MSDCNRFESMLDKDVSALLAHAADCETCRGLLALHGDLAEAGRSAPEPDDADLDHRQERVLREIRLRRARRPVRYAALAAGVVLPFALGLVLGRALPRSGSTPRLLDTLHAEAASNHGLTEVEDSPFTYSNVSYSRLPGDRVALDFDVTTHLTSVESPRSPLVREVLAQSLLNPASVGERLKAMSFAASGLEPKLEKAVLFALRNDESVAVRLAALTVLVGRLDDEEVRSSLIASLRDDPSVQVRLAALESLASHRVDPRRIREAIHERPEAGNEALMVRLAELERKP